MKVLVIGGAGFIGSHTVDALPERGYSVRVFDSLECQVPGRSQRPPDYLNRNAEFIYGDVRDQEALLKALDDIDAIFYLAAIVGVGQSMYEIRRYVEINTLGCANLLEILTNKKHKVKKLIIASPMSVYGKGAYECPN